MYESEDFGTANFRPMNRGAKLLPRTAEPEGAVFRPVVCSIMASAQLDELTRVEKIGKKRAITRRQRPASEDDEEEESPYAGINIDEIWAPLEKEQDVIHNKAHVRTLRSRQLKVMAHSLMETVEKETELNQPLVRLVDALQHDDPFLQDFDLGALGVSAEVQKEFRDVVQDCVNCNFEYLRQTSMVRAKLMVAHGKKKVLAKKLAPFPKKRDN
ncbi:hypothetical protein HDU98_007429 [Podochytrium sp. JEL0797]|nr:hypothetical protein HDU98_007429 [Podochytrium sp. JEL0797]